MTEENEIWSAYAKGVKQIVRTSKKTTNKTKAKKTSPATGKSKPDFRRASATVKIPPAVSMKKGKPFQELLDRRTERQLKQGSFIIEARLDLHGKTQEDAYAALGRFLAAQIKNGSRNLLIITGKGKDGRGALRINLVHWLETFPHAGQILGVRPASPKHGGGGAFYLILRRQRPDLKDEFCN